jgi:translation elongation factor P/translation initiation factor 5A
MYELDKEKVDDVVDYLKENLDVYLMLFEGEVL